MSAPAEGLVGKRNGSVQLDYLQSEDYLSSLAPLAASLPSPSPLPPWDARSLSTLVGGLAQFQEDALGASSLYKSMPRLPARCLRDASPRGALSVIAGCCAEAARARGSKALRIDWVSPAARKGNLDLLARCAQELRRAGLLRAPRVWLSPELGERVAELQKVVERLGGEVVAGAGEGPTVAPAVSIKAEDAGQDGEAAPGVKLEERGGATAGLVLPTVPAAATHAIFPFGPKGDPDDGKQYLRSLERRGGRTRVHWWYYPDSYDEWVPTDLAPVELEPEPAPEGRRHWLLARWVSDSERFNEWMCEADYELDEDDPRAAGRKAEAEAASRPPAASGGAPAPAKRKAAEGAEEEEEEAAAAKRPRALGAEESEPVGDGASRLLELPPGGGRRALEAGGSVVDISQGQPAPGSQEHVVGVPEARDVAGVEAEGSSAAREPSPELVAFSVPACAAWFRWTAASRVERAAFPAFFGPGARRGEAEYLALRNAMVDLYRRDPLRELTFTEARRWVADDVHSLRTVFEFLQAWGLVNAQAVLPAQRPGPLETLGTLGGAAAAGAAAAGAEAVLRLPRAVPGAAGAEAALGGAAGVRPAGAQGEGTSGFGAANGGLSEGQSKVRYFCNAMPWVDCTALRYHCTKLPDTDLCPRAFAEGRFPAGTSATDYVRVEGDAPAPDASGWTDQESLLLLEGVERWGEDWRAIADHVGSRTPLQCVTRFLQLPLASLADGLLQQRREGGLPHAEQEQPRPPRDAAAPDWVDVPPPPAAGLRGWAEPDAHRAAALPPELLPFADTSNPVLAQVAFLAALVGSRVAAAAAQAALEALVEEAEGGGVEGAEGGEVGMGGEARDGEAEQAEARDGEAKQAEARDGEAKQAEARDGEAGPHDIPNPLPVGARPFSGAVPISTEQLRAAAAAGLGAAAVKARLLAAEEEREVERLVLAAVDAQVRRIQLKLGYLEQVEEAMLRERAKLEGVRFGLASQIPEHARPEVGKEPAPESAAPVVAAGGG